MGSFSGTYIDPLWLYHLARRWRGRWGGGGGVGWMDWGGYIQESQHQAFAQVKRISFFSLRTFKTHTLSCGTLYRSPPPPPPYGLWYVEASPPWTYRQNTFTQFAEVLTDFSSQLWLCKNFFLDFWEKHCNNPGLD